MPSGCDIFRIPLLVWVYCVLQYAKYWYREKCIHIGVGFDVARSTVQGNAKASECGMSNR